MRVINRSGGNACLPVKVILWTALAVSFNMGLSSLCYAQLQTVAQIPAQANPGLLTPKTQEQFPGSPQKMRTKLPILQTKPPPPPLPQEKQPVIELENADFMVKSIQVEGNTIVKDAEIQPLLSPYEGRTVNLKDLSKLVDLISALYYNKGYYTSQAYIPPQSLEQQILIIKVQEGRIGQIEVVGNRFLKTKTALQDLGYQPGSILNAKDLEERLQRISEKNGAYKAKAVLAPGKQPGQTDIQMEIRERLPLQISPTFDNQGRPYIGTYRWGVALEDVDLTGVEDRFNAAWFGAAGTQIATSSYFRPINKYGTELGGTFAFSQVHLDLNEPNQPNTVGHSYDYAGVLLQPLGRERHFTADLTMNYRRIITMTNGSRSPHGLDEIATLRCGLSYTNTDRFGRNDLRVETSVAPGWMGANRKFWKNNFLASRLIFLPKQNLVILKASAQLTPDALPSAEMMQIGGAYSVRGYTEGLLVGDRGYSLSVEHRWPIPGLRLISPVMADRIQGATFFDFGQVWINKSNRFFIGNASSPEHTLLAGAGVGLRIQLSRLIQGFVDLGWGLVNRSNVEPNAQPTIRVHFGIRSNLLPEEYKRQSVSKAPKK